MLLPGPLAWIKKTLGILKSNLTPNQIALGVALGVFAGLPPIGLHVVIPCTVAVLVRCSFRAFLVSFGLFELLSLAIAPGAYAVGRWLLDTSRGLDHVWRALFHLPVLAPMGYSRYFLFGSLTLSALFAVPVFVLVRLLVVRYRTSFARRVSGWRLSRWLALRRGIGVVRWAFAGGSAKYETKASPRGLFRLVRREGLLLLPTSYAACYLLAALAVPFFAGTLLTSTASWIAGTDVSVSESSFSLFTGRLELSDFSVQDPDAPTENLVEIPSITLDAGMIPLLAKRVVFDDVVIADASLHVVREPDGTLNLDNAATGWNVDGYLEWAENHARDVDWLGLLRQFLKYLSDVRPLPPRGDPHGRLRGGRSFPDVRPPLTVRRIEIGRILLALEDRLETAGPLPAVTLLEVEISNLAFPVSLRDRPISIRLRGTLEGDPDAGFTLSAVFAEGEVPSSTFAVSITRIDLARIARFYRTTLPVDVISAKATATAEIRLGGGEASGTASLLVEDLVVSARAERPLFGLPPATSDAVVDGLNRYAEDLPIVVGFAIGGTATAPTFEWEAALLEIARDGLQMSGERRLASTIEDLGVRIGAPNATPVLDPDYESLRASADTAARAIIQSATGIFDVPADAEATGEADAPSLGIGELLERLFRDGDGGE